MTAKNIGLITITILLDEKIWGDFQNSRQSMKNMKMHAQFNVRVVFTIGMKIDV